MCFATVVLPATLTEINSVLLDLAENVPDVHAVSAEGLTHLGDNSHFDAPSQKILGERYAESVMEVVYKDK